MSAPFFSIVTPSYRQARWLGLCAASVADQDVEAEHIVQDSLSGPEVAEALAPFPRVKLVSEKDAGMYDAINRGWEKAGGEILAWLNCDEQYLPGTLETVAGYFRDRPETDILFADAVVVDEAGGYLCSRQVLPPQLEHTWICHLQTFSCAAFFRRHLIKERGFLLDPRWRVAGDADLILRMLRGGVKTAVLRKYASAFLDNGDNLGLSPRAVQERDALAAEAPRWMRALRPWWVVQHRLRRLWHRLYWPCPFSYDIYTQASPQKRIHFDVPRPTFYWRTRMK
ncbi:MAG TPA: glycosyltransferase [Candidatus Methylacidiphilales bacterium]|nr:glycosyltransferase [Candidatus Methylacidiphilales bacterium]